jgi:hypothetical protein
MPVRGVIEFDRYVRLLGEGAEPLAIVADKTTDLPPWQFEFNQCERRIGPSAGLEELLDVSSLSHLRERWNSLAGFGDDVGEEIRRDRLRKAKLVGKAAETVLVSWVEQHDTSRNDTSRMIGP